MIQHIFKLLPEVESSHLAIGETNTRNLLSPENTPMPGEPEKHALRVSLVHDSRIE